MDMDIRLGCLNLNYTVRRHLLYQGRENIHKAAFSLASQLTLC